MYPVSREMLAWQGDTNSLPSFQCTNHHRICQFSLLMHFNHVPKFSLSKLVDIKAGISPRYRELSIKASDFTPRNTIQSQIYQESGGKLREGQ